MEVRTTPSQVVFRVGVSMVSPQKPTDHLEDSDECATDYSSQSANQDGSARVTISGEDSAVRSIPEAAHLAAETETEYEPADDSVGKVASGQAAAFCQITLTEPSDSSVLKTADDGTIDTGLKTAHEDAHYSGSETEEESTADGFPEDGCPGSSSRKSAEDSLPNTADEDATDSSPGTADDPAEDSVPKPEKDGSAIDLVIKKARGPRKRKCTNTTTKKPIPSMGPQVCHVCHKTLCNKAVLKQHLRTHTGERPYACELCPQKFTTSNGLFVHKRKHTGEKPFVCDVCDRKFSTWVARQSHMTTHTGEKAHQCLVCGKRFARRDTLQLHFRIHTGERPYPCSLCPKTYRYRDALQRHERKHRVES